MVSAGYITFANKKAGVPWKVYNRSMYFVYMLRCRDGSLYTGITNDLQARLGKHRAGTASRYTRAKGAGEIVYTERKRNRSTASRREAEIKRLSRQEKLHLIESVASL
jgi:putative endonuclease